MNRKKIENVDKNSEQGKSLVIRDKALFEKASLELLRTNKTFQLLNDNLENDIRQKIEETPYNESKYKKLIESVQDLIYKISPDGHFTFVNSFVKQMLGYDTEEIIGKSFISFVDPSYRGSIVKYYNEILFSNKMNCYLEFPVYSNTGELKWIGQTIKVIEENNEKEFIAVARDITEDKKVQDMLLNTQTRLSTLISSLCSGIVVVDEHQRIIFINQYLCDLFNMELPLDYWIGKDYQELAFLIDKELRGNKDYYTIIDQILLNREVYTNEVLVSSSGKVLERSFIPIVINNAYCGFLWQFNDITEKSSFQDKIIRSEEKYRGIMDNMELGLLEVDNKHTIIRAYDRFCKMVGYTEEELLGKNAVDTFLNRSYHQVIEQHQTLRIGGKGSTYELPLIKKDGSIVWTLVSGSPILNVEGAVIGSIGIHYDLTERKKVEKDLNEAKTLAENARQAEKQFLANMSHEIRTPLNAIIGMVHLLLDTEPNSKQKEYLDSLNSSASFLHNLISNLLDLAKIDAGKIDIRKVEFNLETLLSDIVKIFELKSIKKDLKFSLKLTSINSKIFFGDEILIKQIFLNLIGNAEKFTENGEIKIGAEKVFSDSENRKTGINFYVEDTGKGISTNELESIFYKYKQADNQDLYNKGTGLGLAITKELIELLGGKIKVKSTLDEGTRFEFYLPLEEYSITSKVQKEDIPILHNPTLINILVAEDNLMNQKYISTLLNKWGFKCTIVENGEMVKSAICNEVYNLIFMDLQMPIVNGYDATLFIRQSNTENATIPVVALTASVLLEQKKLAFESGVTDFLAKPFTPKQLSEIIMKYV